MELKASQRGPKKCLKNSGKYPNNFSPSWLLLLFIYIYIYIFIGVGAIFNIHLVQLAQVAARYTVIST